jgi:hypothetical protein
VLKISLVTAERHWIYAHTWLFAELEDRAGFVNLQNFFLRIEGF